MLKLMLLSFSFQICLLSSMLFLLLFLNVDLGPLKRSLNSFSFRPIYVFVVPSFFVINWGLVYNRCFQAVAVERTFGWFSAVASFLWFCLLVFRIVAFVLSDLLVVTVNYVLHVGRQM